MGKPEKMVFLTKKIKNQVLYLPPPPFLCNPNLI